jgi:peptidoglycan/LPS O-acetylase OafA/YrhL
VIWHHSTPYPLPGFWGRGPAGVDLFFCISGFLITTLLLREKAKQGRINLRHFYLRRALRILPLYYLTLLGHSIFVLLLLPANHPSGGHFWGALPFYMTFTANWFVNLALPFPMIFSFAWSLCVEEQFYAFWPGLVSALRRTGALVVMSLLVGIDLLLQRGWPVQLATDGVTFRIATSLAMPIGMGAILALLLDSSRGFGVLWRLLGHSLSAPLSLVALLACLVNPSPLGIGYQLALAALVGSCVIQERHALRAMLTARPVVYVGLISYGLYLLHPAVIGLVHVVLPQYRHQAWVVFALTLPLALALAALSHRFIEAPMRRVGLRASGLRLQAKDSLRPRAPVRLRAGGHAAERSEAAPFTQ